MKNKKGFTLIEILAVILVLGIIITIAVPAISYLIKKQRRNYYVAEDQNVKLSTEDYFNTNRDLKPQGAYGRITVELDKLIEKDYIGQVVDADNKKTCSGYGMAVNTGNKNYEYYTCIKCNCSNGNCEYVTDTTEVYNTAANLCTDDYNPQGYIKTPGTIYSYNGRSIDKNKLVGKVYIRLNNQDIDWKVSVPASNTGDININQNNKYVLNYNYSDISNEIGTITATSNYIVYQYKAPNVTPVGFSWGSAIKNTLKVNLEPNGIFPENVTPPKFTVSEYQVSYALSGTDNWSDYKKVTCTIGDNKCTNGTFDISNLASGTYKLKFRFIDTNKNISLVSTGDYTFKIAKEFACPTIVVDVAKETWTNKDVNLTITANDTFASWEWLTNKDGDSFVSWGENTGSTTKTLSAEGVRQGKIIIKNDYGETKECPPTSKYYIDKTAPICANVAKFNTASGNNYSNSSWTNQNVYTSANCSDSLSGCRSENLRSLTTRGATTNVTDQYYNTWTAYAEGTSYITWSVYDNAGNKDACSTITAKIDNTPPRIYYNNQTGACCVTDYDKNITSIINYRAEDDLSGITLIRTKHCYDMGSDDSQTWYCAYTPLTDREFYIRKDLSDNPQSVYKNRLELLDTGKVNWIIDAADAAGNDVQKSFSMPASSCPSGYSGVCSNISCPTTNCP